MTRFIPRPAVLAAAAAQALLALLVWTRGSTGPIAMHFNITGEVDRWGGRGEMALVIGGLAVLTLVAGGALAMSAARREADAARRRGLAWAQTVLVTATCIIAAMMGGLAIAGAGAADHGLGLVLMAICALFVAIGAFMGKVAPNALVGVRTPWSLTSRLAWEKSNRLGGRLFFWGGLAGMILAPAAPQPLAMQVLVGAVLLIAGTTVFESWRVWRADPERNTV
ncbi:MAG: SdpI family protein [Caulobacter sp.]|nr:SdpI family protein [Caulobacter sp.]